MAEKSNQAAIGDGSLHVGDRVVYPNQGICRITGVAIKNISNLEIEMVTLSREEDGATVMVPKAKVMGIGLRKVADVAAIDKVFDELTAPGNDPQLDWKVRHRENAERMSGGGLFGTVEVLRGLHTLSRVRPLPPKERELYDNARHLLVGEIAAAMDIPLHVAEDNLDYALWPPVGMKRKGRELPPATLGPPAPLRAAGDDDLGFEDEEAEEETPAAGATAADEEEGDEDEAPAPKKPAAKKAAKGADAAAKKAPAESAAKKAAGDGATKPAGPRAVETPKAAAPRAVESPKATMIPQKPAANDRPAHDMDAPAPERHPAPASEKHAPAAHAPEKHTPAAPAPEKHPPAAHAPEKHAPAAHALEKHPPAHAPEKRPAPAAHAPDKHAPAAPEKTAHSPDKHAAEKAAPAKKAALAPVPPSAAKKKAAPPAPAATTAKKAAPAKKSAAPAKKAAAPAKAKAKGKK